jgi:thiamine biosynthesis lipoprotein
MPNFTIEFRAMGSHIQAWLAVPKATDADILNQLPLWFESWEARFSRFRASSELCRLNQEAGQWVSVSAEMGEVIALALKSAQMTDGLFNPLILPAVEAAGYDHDFTGVDYQPGVKRSAMPGAVAVADWYMIEWDAKRQRVRLPVFARIDLGGIVKGWAAQRTADRLQHYGACLVDAAGDMAAFGAPDDSGGWQVGIAPQADPDSDLEMARYTVNLSDAGIATSGVDYRHWLQNGQPMHHLIDPRTGQPTANDILTATVIASDTIQAEALAKATLISGSGDLANRAGLAALLVHTDQSVSWNAAFEKLDLIRAASAR